MWLQQALITTIGVLSTQFLSTCLASAAGNRFETHTQMVAADFPGNAPSSPSGTATAGPLETKAIAIPISTLDSTSNYPVIEVLLGDNKTPVKLGISLRNPKTWLRTKYACQDGGKSCPFLVSGSETKDLLQVPGLCDSGQYYTITKVESAQPQNPWEITKVDMGMCWAESPNIATWKNIAGVLGLGWGSTFLSKFPAAQNGIGLHFKAGGALVIGGYYPRQSAGGFQKLDATPEATFNIKSLSIGESGRYYELLTNSKAILDASSPYIALPKAIMERLFQRTDGVWAPRADSDVSKFASTQPPFRFNLGDITIEVDKDSYMIPEGLGFTDSPDDTTILGLPFLKSAYLVQDPRVSKFYLAQAIPGDSAIAAEIQAIPTDLDKLPGTGTETTDGGAIAIPTAGQNPIDSNKGKDTGISGPNAGVIAGAVIGTLLGLLAIAALIFFLRRRRANKSAGASAEKGGESSSMGFAGSGAGVARSSTMTPPPAPTHENTYLMEGYTSPSHSTSPPPQLPQIVTGDAGLAVIPESGHGFAPASGLVVPRNTQRGGNWNEEDDVVSLTSVPSTRGAWYAGRGRGGALSRSVSVNTVSEEEIEEAARRSRVVEVPRLPIYTRGGGEAAL